MKNSQPRNLFCRVSETHCRGVLLGVAPVSYVESASTPLFPRLRSTSHGLEISTGLFVTAYTLFRLDFLVRSNHRRLAVEGRRRHGSRGTERDDPGAKPRDGRDA